MNVLFVCSGNICRSPMAEVWLRRALAEAGLGDVGVGSAGTLGIEGAPASAEAVRALAEIGLDLRGHRSRGVRTELLDAADLVVAMEQAHLDELRRRFPGETANRRLIRAFEHDGLPAATAPDLPDPMGSALPVYRGLIRVLEPCIEHLATHVEALRASKRTK